MWSITQHNIVHLVCNLVYYIYYKYEFPCIERYKTNWEEPWPWHKDPEGWRSLVKKSILVCFFNGNIVSLMFFIPLAYSPAFKEHDMETEDVPSTMTLAGSMLFCMLCEDMTFYCSHRFLHLSWVYPYIHKMHHEYSHTVGIASEYTHPVEFALGNILPTSVGPLILGPHMHLLTVFAWYALRIGESLDGHCGYDFSFSPYRLIPFSGSASYHDYHHSQNVGNYGSFFQIWDTIFGTNRDYF